jgi:hypothetical protein
MVVVNELKSRICDTLAFQKQYQQQRKRNNMYMYILTLEPRAWVA